MASIATNSTVSVAAGAVLQLDFATTNIVAGFVTNGVSLPAGVYNAVNLTPFITGPGSLEIVSAGPGAPGNFSAISVSGTTLTLSVTNGTPLGPWTLLESTNLLVPVAQWWTNRTGTYDITGGLTTNIVNGATNPAAFYRLK